jgi:hypothetical protein
MAKPTRQTDDRDEQFYESLPAMADRYMYRDVTMEEPDVDSDFATVDETRLTAIVTIVLTILVTIGLGLVFIRGVETLQSVTPTQNSQAK